MSRAGGGDESTFDRIRERVVPEYVVIGAALFVVTFPTGSGLVSVSIPHVTEVTATLAGIGIGIALYGYDTVRRSASVFAMATGASLFVGGALQYYGVWAAILAIWGGALLLFGAASYASIRLARY